MKSAIVTTGWVLGGMIGLTLFSVTLPVCAQEEEWHAERDKFKMVIEARIQAELDKKVSRQALAGRLKMGWPVKEPADTLEDIVARVDAGIDGDVADRFPEDKREEFETEAAEKYRIYEKGDEIEFIIRGGRGANTFVEGQLLETTDGRVRVGERWIPKRDMSEETCANFWPEESEKYQKRHIRIRNIRYDAKIDSFRSDLRKERLPKAFQKGGYIPRPKRSARSPKPEDWISRRDLLEAYYKYARKQYEGTIRKRITEEVYVANGYVLVREKGEWMPKRVAASVRDRLASLLKNQGGGQQNQGDGEFEDDGGEWEEDDGAF